MEPAICAPPLQGNHSLGFARVSHALAGFAQNREKKAFKLATRSFILPKNNMQLGFLQAAHPARKFS
jgi:hypothetical protein